MTRDKSQQDIAIIGYHGRFPKSETEDLFWKNLSRGEICTELTPETRWDADFFSTYGQGTFKHIKPWGGFLEGIDRFDALLFKISPKSARAIDPQQRLFIESAWTVLEHAGYGDSNDDRRKKTGLFVGSMWQDYAYQVHETCYVRNKVAGTRTMKFTLANQASHILDLSGPSLSIDNACTSSLMAIHLACQSLRTGECNMAIAGGVNLTLHPDKYFYLAQEELLAEQQITACFVPEAKGYIPGEGVGTLLLKPLVAALDEGDTIYGVIKATATNHNGGGMFFKVPSSGAQADLMRNVLAKADLTPNQLSHIEMSAYGAEITDQTELNSLFKVFRKHWDKQHVCSLGSLKPNIGHLESAAGISQVIKVLLQFKYQKRVPLLFDSGIIEEFELEESPFQLNAELSDWETGGHPRYAAINSFGAGGANACMILEEPPPRASVQGQPSESSHLIVLSARETETLKTYANHFKNFLKESTATPALKDIAYTLQTGRTPMQERLAVIAEDKSEVIKALENYLSEKDTATGWFRGTVDEDRQIASPEELEKSTLEELAKTWVEKDIDWHALSREGHSNKVALPTYPFLHDRVYWIDHEGGSREKETRLSLSNTEEAVTDPSSKSHIINFLKGLITREISLQAELIDENKNLADYGLDSVVFRKLLVSLKEHFDSLSPSLFYKYKTIRELADFLLFHHPATIDRLLDLDITETNLPTRQIASPQSDIPPNKRALYHSGLPANDGISREDLAIIGVSGRYPKSASIGQFWKNLKENKDFITSFPPERLFDGEQTESCRGSFIDDVDKFDPLFFEISPKDAVAIDPQERLFLQTAWEVIEDAGYNIEEFQAKDGDIQGRVGVFLGTMWSDYQRWGFTPSSYWSIPNRVSYFLNLKGPSLAVDSACSSSLTAIYLACESIRRGESKLAIAGGINLTLHPDKFHYLSEKGLAADGDEIKVFTDEGKGYLPGEGVGAILLKPLKDAVKDGDHIHAVVKGIAINHGGKSNGFMAPNPDAQAEVIEAALKNANVSPESVSYIDVNAVGSATGDAIELETLSAVFSETTPDKRFCALGSLKSGLGHLEAASGISQVTKVLLQFKHQMLLPTLKNGIDAFDQNLENSPFCASKVLAPWNPGEGQLPRRAAISSFGAGGSNAHLILEEYRHSEQTFREKPATTHLFVFSARTKQQLVHTVSNFKEFIAANSDTNLNEVAFTLQAGRKAMSERVAIVAASHSELLACCDAYINRNNNCTLSNTYEGSALNSAGDQANQVSSESENEALESLIKVHAWEKLAAAWVQGASVPWKKTYKDDLPRRVSLPTYPFEKKSYWPEQPASSQKTLAVNQTRFGGLKELTPQAYLTSRIAVFLGIDSEELQEEKPLLEYGLDSINATKLKYELEKELKHDIPLSLLGKSRHLKEMVQQLETNESLSAVKQQIEDFLAGTHADKTENPDDTAESNKNNDKFAPFPLTDIQESFLSGKLLGNKSDYVGCHIYLELEVDQLDISRLQASWQVLVEYHDILHTRVSEDGYQQLLEEIPELEIELHHLQDFEANDTEKHLASLRSQMSHQVYEPGQWPLFEIQVTQLSKKKSIIHFSIDEWVVDAASLYLLLSQWFQLYSKNIDTLPTLGFSFREYVLAAKQRERGQQFENNLSYWTNKLKNLPAQPELKWQENPVLKPGNVCFERTRYHYTLPSRKRSALVEQASRLNISLTTLILSLFSETLYANSAERVVFSIVLTVYNRLPVHPQVDMVLGPFISTNIFLAEPYSDLSLGERAKQYQSQLWEDLDHQSVSGIRALRELKKQKKISKSRIIPFVFTSMLNDAGKHTSTNKASWFDNITYMVTQTPQVYLDHQIVERNGELVFTWDVAEELFQPGVIREIFSGFCKNLEYVANNHAVWQEKDLNKIKLQAHQFSTNEDISNYAMTQKNNQTDRNQSFALAPLQHAYVVGRSSMIKNGDISGQIYHEFEIDHPDIDLLNRVWRQLIESHDMLRVVISANGNQYIQKQAPDYTIEQIELKGKGTQQTTAALETTKQEMIERVFPLDSWPFFDLRVSRLSDSKAILHFKMDMLIAAGNSIYLVLKQLFYYYHHPQESISVPEFSYREYITALNEYKSTDHHKQAIAYWMDKFANIPPGPQLPMRADRAADSPVEREQFKNSLQHWCMIEDKAEALEVDPASVLLTVYGEVLLAWNNNRPLTIVVVDWERPPLHDQIDEVVGDFTVLNWLPVEKSELSFSEKVKRAHRVVANDKNHKMVSGLESLHRSLRKRKTKENMVFPFVFTNFMPHSQLELPASVENRCGISQTPQVLIDYVYYVEDDCLEYHWDTLISEFAEGMIEDAFAGYNRILKALIDDDETWERTDFDEMLQVGSADFIGGKSPKTIADSQADEDLDNLLNDLNQTDKEYPKNVCLHQLIEKQAEATPFNTAVVFEERTLTYQQLNSASNQIAHSLIKKGVGRDRIVGVLMDRSIEMVLALVSILKAGGAYLPLDPSYPQERLGFMVEDAEVSVILTQSKYLNGLPGFKGEIIALDDDNATFHRESEANPDVVMEETDLAYVIFTSGSTGKPKGCLLPHLAICNRIFWMQDEYQLTDTDRVLQKTPFTFDVSVWEFFWPLITGAQLIVAKPNGHKDNGYLVDLIQKQQITTCHFVPSMLSFFVEEPGIEQCHSLRQVFVSGEALNFQVVRRFMSRSQAKLHNLYGPTEAAVDVTYWECHVREDKKIPIGKPISNIKLYILDEQLKRVPMGESGELYISGVGLARGYLNREDLTAERFLKNPFGNERNPIIYKTGDRVRYLGDGNIEYLERIDTQVKLRGFRIELNEIVETLLTHEKIKQAAVAVQDKDTGDPKLVAYLVHRDQPELPSKEIRSFLKAKLPEYMVPNMVVPMESLPVTHHGKMDNKALPWPINRKEASQKSQSSSKGPDIKDTLSMVSGLFEEKLKVTPINPEEDLFDLGATSLTIVQVSQKIQANLDIEISVDEFLEDPTIGGISKYIHQQLCEAGPDADVSQAITDEEIAESDSTSNPLEPGNDSSIFLKKDGLLPEEFRRRQCSGSFSKETVSFLSFSRMLELFKQSYYNDKKKFLYPSAGDLNAVQIYVYVKPNAVESLAEGVYYHDPIQHRLYPVSNEFEISGALYLDVYQETVEQAGFLIFFIGQQNAVYPVYNKLSASLMILDTGYMTQLLLNRQGELNIGLQTVYGIDFNNIRSHFQLDSGHTFITCLAGGAKAGPEQKETDDPQKALLDYVVSSRNRFDKHFFCDNFDRSMLDPEIKLDLSSFSFLSKEDHIRFKEQVLHLRKFPAQSTFISLEKREFTQDEYFVRSCQRHYEEREVPLENLGGFLSLLAPHIAGDEISYLFPRIAANDGIQIYLYVKKAGVENLKEGIYQYHPFNHSLTLICDEVSPAIKNVHYPFNRSHFLKSKFSVLFFAKPDALQEVAGKDSMLYLYLQSGYMGQVLMDYQAEYNIGICPIGGMKFDKIRQDFKLDEETVLLHSFTCGYYENPHQKTSRLQRISENAEPPVVGGKANNEDIAVSGIAARFPQADNAEQFWQNLVNGKRSITRFPKDRAGNSSGWGGFLEQIDRFDAELFGISDEEAHALDPQERLFLEIAWECLENAGYTAEELKRCAPKVGVFVGVMWNDYQSVSTESWYQSGHVPNTYLRSSIANRVSHIFDFNGPSVVIDTSCSSAMTAFHVACQAVKNGECQAAIVGGINLLAHPYHHNLLKGFNLLSRDDKCQAFSADGTGWVAGEGVGAALITPLQQAKDNNNHIYGVIKGTTINHCGQTKRYGIPNSSTQAESLRDALWHADLEPASISYVESQATGSTIADASEILALSDVFRHDHTKLQSVALGSVKPNIGHLESASTMSQFIKVLMQMKHDRIAPSIDSQPLNPLMKIEKSPFYIADKACRWSDTLRDHQKNTPLRAVINSIGATGSMGHMLLEAYDQSPGIHPEEKTSVPVVLSAMSHGQLMQLTTKLLEDLSRIKEDESISLVNIAFTLAVGRTQMIERVAFIVDSLECLEQKLSAYVSNQMPDDATTISGSGGVADQQPVNAASLTQAARLWCEGKRINWSPLFPVSAKRVGLPAYPFTGKRYWLDQSVKAVNVDQPSQQFEPIQQTVASEYSSAAQRKNLEEFLIKVVAEEANLNAANINSRQPMERYGVGSKVAMKLNMRLHDAGFQNLSTTLFFEHRTISELSTYLINRHSAQVRQLVRNQGAEPVLVQQTEPIQTTRVNKPQYPAVNPAVKDEDIAIVGMDGRFPGANSLSEFWDLLNSGTDWITEIPKDRWDADVYFDEDKLKAGKSCSKWGAFIDDVDKFDPAFFNMSPKEAAELDPQERLLLEIVWRTMEDAGYLRKTEEQPVGVFIGSMYQHYPLLQKTQTNGTILNNSAWSMANRLSYFFNFSGPSLTIDTACSSSLYAIHLACESIKRGESSWAVAGAVNLNLHPVKYLELNQQTLLSSDSKSRAFGESDGFIPGEGVGAVLLKPLATAKADGDHIYGVIKSHGGNHGGTSNGMFVPNPKAHISLVQNVLNKADISAETISYVESSANGALWGDAVEFNALKEVYQTNDQASSKCSIGSLKSNIGHLEAASGMSQLIKVLLQMKHQRLVPTINCTPLNPNIILEDSSFSLQTTGDTWRQPAIIVNGREETLPRRAAINSFGAGGANAHLIVEEWQETENESDSQGDEEFIFALSARDQQQLHAYLERIITHITPWCREKGAATRPVSLQDFIYTLQVGREPMTERVAFLAKSFQEVLDSCQVIVNSPDSDELPGIFMGSVSADQNGLEWLADEGLLATVQNQVMTQKDLHQIARFWVKGLDINWQKLYLNRQPKRVSLPTYPFKRQRCWVDTIPETGEKTNTGIAFGTNGGADPLTITILQRVATFLGLSMADVKPELKFDQFGFDSIKAVKLKYDLEKQLGVEIPTSVISSSKTVGDVVHHVSALKSSDENRPSPGNGEQILEEFLKDQSDLSSVSDNEVDQMFLSLLDKIDDKGFEM